MVSRIKRLHNLPHLLLRERKGNSAYENWKVEINFTQTNLNHPTKRNYKAKLEILRKIFHQNDD